MRSLINRKDDSKRNQIILGGFLIIVMVFSTLGYALSGRDEGETDNKIEYNGIEFISDNSGYCCRGHICGLPGTVDLSADDLPRRSRLGQRR